MMGWQLMETEDTRAIALPCSPARSFSQTSRRETDVIELPGCVVPLVSRLRRGVHRHCDAMLVEYHGKEYAATGQRNRSSRSVIAYALAFLV